MAIEVKELNVKQLNELIVESYDFQLLDVREPDEFQLTNLNGDLIPLNTIPNNVDKIERSKPVAVLCRTGKRSLDAIIYLQKEHGFDNLYNVKGGIHAWSDEIDSSVPKY